MLFRTSILVSRPFTFLLLAHPIPKSLSHPDLAPSLLQLLLSKTYSSVWGRSHSCSLFFIPGNSLPILQVQPARPGPLSSPCSQGSGTGFDFSFPPFSALGAGLLIAA